MSTNVVPPDLAASVDRASLDAITDLVRDVRAVFDQGRTRPLAWRAAQIDGLLKMITEREGELSAALAEDLGKPALEAYGADITVPRNELNLMRKKLKAWNRERRVSLPFALMPGKATISPEPLGVVLVIAPWNYPFQLSVTPIAGAIAAGNAVVIKPSELAPATSAFLARTLPQYVDSTAIRVVEGAVPETTRLLEQRWDHIFYTGNGTVARVVLQAAAKHITPCTLELGGKSPTYVDSKANLEVAARRIAFGKFYNAGQTCVAPDYVLAHESIHDELVKKIGESITAFYGADPKASPDYARIVNTRHHKRLAKLLEGGGKVAIGGAGDEAERFMPPTVMTGVTADDAVMADEIFGPILPVMKVKSLDEAISFINARPKPLALYGFSEDSSVGDALIERTSSGSVCINHTVLQTTIESLPFGGVGESGMGAYHGRASFDIFSHGKSVFRKPTFLDPQIAYPPYTAQKTSIVRKVL